VGMVQSNWEMGHSDELAMPCMCSAKVVSGLGQSHYCRADLFAISKSSVSPRVSLLLAADISIEVICLCVEGRVT
jgi:hypothetical protein